MNTDRPSSLQLPPPGTQLHFIGIGGIGMSALARYFYRLGYRVSGYDRTETALTRELQTEGLEVYYQPDPAKAMAAALVVYTPALPASFPELAAVLQAGRPCMKRAAVLGALAATRRTLAVAGTHGKTTTCSLATTLLTGTGLDPTAFVGGIMQNFGSNHRLGGSDLLVVEADEFDRSFLHLHPQVAILTSMDADHLDIYGDAVQVQQAYGDFLQGMPAGATAIVHRSLYDRVPAMPGRTVYYYGADEGVQALDLQTFTLHHIRQQGFGQRFDLLGPGLVLQDLDLPYPGLHNAENAAAALLAAWQLGASPEALREALRGFRGVRRRFELLLEGPLCSLIDDYAHHPAELSAAIATARRCYPERFLLVCFQPHLFTRTRDFAAGFGQSLSGADAVLLMHIYPARELSIPGVSSELIYSHIQGPPVWIVNLEDLPDTLSDRLQSIDKPVVVLTLGAGDIDTQLEKIRQVLLITYPSSA